MKKFLLTAAAIALALTAASALAADLPSRKEAPVYVPSPPPPLWTGFYIGLNAGGAFGGSNNISVTTVSLTPGVDPAASAVSSGVANNNVSGFIGGGQVGYNWQFSNAFVAGIEADIQGVAGSSGSSSFANASPGVITPLTYTGTVSTSQSLDYLGTVRGRIGYLFTPTLLLYGTGGLAYGGANLSFVGTGTAATAAGAVIGAASGGTSSSGTLVGRTAGAGLEWLFAPNWSAKLEYLYYDLGSYTLSSPVQASAAGITGLGVSQASAQFNGHIVRAGLNYHFNWGAPAPVVAKY